MRPPARKLAFQLGAATLARLILNTSRRFAYPFASALSRGLGVPLAAITSLIAVNQVTGVLSPVFGPLGDRWGYRVMMLAGLGMLTGGMLAGGLLPVYGVVLLALFLAGLGKSVFDPALHAYVGGRVPFQRRGLAIGMLEFAWAGSALVGIPLVGLLIERLGWRSPFFVLGGLGLLSAVALGALIPDDSHQQRSSDGRPGLRQAWRRLSRERAALGALGFGLLISAANDNLFVVYGIWLESAFGLSIAVLGAATTVIGLAELLGEGLTASIADQLGLKRAIAAGSILSALSYILLPLVGRTLPLALIGLFITFLTFEFTIVTAITLFTEILPAARATMMSSSVAAISIGRAIGALVGGPVWLAGGMLATGFVSAAVSGLALALLVWGLRGWRD
ncbi:MAG: MFS transporter [Anaerolineae bacterium]|nr:MFS transporter [Anaerolineae bacterium]